MAVALAVTWRAAVGEEARIREVVVTMARLSRQEPGNLQYIAHTDPDDPRVFFLYEQYRDAAAFEAHKAADHFREHVIEGALPYLESREITFLEPIEA